MVQTLQYFLQYTPDEYANTTGESTLMKKRTRLLSDYEQDFTFINKVLTMFFTLDIDAILAYQHPMFDVQNLTNIENIITPEGYSLLRMCMYLIESLEDLRKFLRFCQELNWSQEFWVNFDRKYLKHATGDIGLQQLLRESTENESRKAHTMYDLLLVITKFAKQDSQTVQQLLDLFVDKNVTNHHGFTALFPLEEISCVRCEFQQFILFDLFGLSVTDYQALKTFCDGGHQRAQPLVRYDWGSLSIEDFKFLTGPCILTTEYWPTKEAYKAYLLILRKLFAFTPSCVTSSIHQEQYKVSLQTFLDVYRDKYTLSNIDEDKNTIVHKLFLELTEITKIAHTQKIKEKLEWTVEYIASLRYFNICFCNQDLMTAFDYLIDFVDMCLEKNFVQSHIQSITSAIHTLRLRGQNLNTETIKRQNFADDLSEWLHSIMWLMQTLCVPHTIECHQERMMSLLPRLTEQIILIRMLIPSNEQELFIPSVRNIFNRILLCTYISSGEEDLCYSPSYSLNWDPHLPKTYEEYCYFQAYCYPNMQSVLLSTVNRAINKYRKYFSEVKSENFVTTTEYSFAEQQILNIVKDEEDVSTRMNNLLSKFEQYKTNFLKSDACLILQASILGLPFNQYNPNSEVMSEWLKHRNNPDKQFFSREVSRTFRHKVINCSDLFRHICSFL
jgi:hypothetical protein